MKIFLYTSFALLAFAFNSILCRLALRGDEADAIAFTYFRLLSGAAALLIISYFAGKLPSVRKSRNWPSALFLFGYAICFSLAYLSLTAGTGALILFGSVQLTMIVTAIVRGERPAVLEWLGLVVAVGGLVYLVLPGLASPPLYASLLMAAAGASWGFYTLRGKGSRDPLADTTSNFIGASVPMTILLIPYFSPQFHISIFGLLLACLSGAVTSGMGYAIWYTALKFHTSTRAAVLQLAVPVLAAFLGVMLLSEDWSVRLGVAAGLILGGIGLTILGRGAEARTK